MNVIAVGNGESVLKHELGDRINQFDVVVRFNDFRSAGFEKHVGTKTTVWARNPSPTTSHRDPALFEYVLIYAPDFLPREPYLYSFEELRHFYPHAILLPADLILQIHHEVNMPQGCLISSGLATVTWLVQKYGHVVVHGFDHFQEPRLHYYSPRQVPQDLRHRPELEAAYLRKLEARGTVTRLVPIS